MSRRALAAAILALAALGAAGPDLPSATPSKAPAPKRIDYDKLTQEATDFLVKYIQIDTSNPPGNELPAARLLKEKLLEAGIPVNIWEPQPGRGVIAARLRGVGRHTKALVLLSHMDVVPANAKEWEKPPFSGAIDGGKIWGRGSLDDKGPGVIELIAMLAIKRAGILLNRDIIFVATGDEEEGGRNGAGWFADHESDIFSDAGFLLNEGGGIHVEPDGKKLYTVSVTEKTPLWLRLTATGPAGHAAGPPAETAVTKLVRALARLDEFKTPIRILQPVEDYYHAMAQLGARPKGMLNLQAAIQEPAFAREFLSQPGQNAAVRDTVAVTVLGASIKTNVISDTAYAEVDCRLLPGSDPRSFLREIKKVIGDDSIKIDVILNFPPVSSPSRSELMTAIESVARRDDHCPVVPTMLSGFTDSHYFRQKKIVSYGFIPMASAPADIRGVHGINERIDIKEMGNAIRRMVMLLEAFGGRSQP
jgi:acetylornithine deacetylase/succinyl-diaminopimelate desuccinylase-like protein